MNIIFDKESAKKIINNEEYLNEAVLLLSGLMDEELEKDENEIDFDFINECSAVLIEIQSGDNADYNKVVPFLNSKEFIARAGKSRSPSRLVKMLLVAAIIAASSITANAAVGTITGQSIIDRIASEISTESVQEEANDISHPKAPETTAYAVIKLPESTTAVSTVESSEPKAEIVITERDRGDKVVFTEPSKEKQTESEKTKREKEKTEEKQTTTKLHVETTTSAPVLYKIDVVVAQGSFKKCYKIGESFDSTGLYVIGYYSDGAVKTLDYGEYSVSGFDSKTAGIKKLRINAGNAVYMLSVTVEDNAEDNTTTEETEQNSEQSNNAD